MPPNLPAGHPHLCDAGRHRTPSADHLFAMFGIYSLVFGGFAGSVIIGAISDAIGDLHGSWYRKSSPVTWSADSADPRLAPVSADLSP
jgi:hypothetical protein